MTITVGIPRALAYHDYFPHWQVFLSRLGVNLLISPPTNQAILNEGVRRAVDGTCLPVKIFYGHVHWLIEQGVDGLFMPRLVSVAPGEYICPKFMGLPDMVLGAFPQSPKAFCPTIDLNRSSSHVNRQLEELGNELGYRSREILAAWHEGVEAQGEHEARLQGGWYLAQNGWKVCHDGSRAGSSYLPHSPSSDESTASLVRIGLLGHSYLIYDEFANMGMVNRLRRMGTKVLTIDMLSPEAIEAQAVKWPKRMFWTSGRRILGAAWEYMEAPVAGIVYVTAFGCGTDSLTAELVERTVRRQTEIPQLILNLDEHTGEAGVVTRLEAFVDMLRWRQNR